LGVLLPITLAAMAPPEVEVVLFDLGGVLIDVGGVSPMKQLSGIENDDELWERWLTCRWVRDFESGRCSEEAFATGVVEDWALAIEPDDFLDRFRRWPGGALPGADELVREVREVVPVGCLSNSNTSHWADFRERWPALDTLDFCFVSFEIGYVKPDHALFDHVARQLPVAPELVLFVDDNTMNVEAARAAGWNAHRTRGVDEARAALIAAGVLS
jgi:putative hydrolase of the HAD superfamily